MNILPLNILPREVTNLLRDNHQSEGLLFVLAGFIALFEAIAVVNFLFLGHLVLGQELPSMFGNTFVNQVLSDYSQRSALIMLGGAFAAITTFRLGLVLVYRYLGFKWSSTVTGNLHKRILNRVISARLQLFSERQTGTIIHGLMVAPNGATTTIDSIVSGISAVFLFLAVGITLTVISPWLSLMAAALGLLFFGTIVRFSRKRVRHNQQRRYERQSRGTEIATDIINGVRDIRVVAAEPRWKAAFADEVDSWEDARRRMQFYNFLPSPTLQTALQASFAVVVVGSAITLPQESLTTQLPVLGVFVYGLFRVFPAITQLSASWITLAQALPNLQAAEEWTSLPTDPLASGAVETRHLRKGLRFEGVCFSYDGGVPVLIDTDFFLEAGKTTALVGPSGTGKSTLIDLMLKFRSPDRGTIWLDEQNLEDVIRQSWLDQVGLVRQESFFFAGTIRDNLGAWQPTAAEEEMRWACGEAGILDFIDSLPNGLDTIVGNQGLTVSAGQRQRLAVARALLRKPNFLILDEATSALDGETESQVLKSLFKDSPGRTIVVISHRLATVRNADHIIVVDQGRVVEQGTHEELVARRGRYWQLFSTQEDTLNSSATADVTSTATR